MSGAAWVASSVDVLLILSDKAVVGEDLRHHTEVAGYKKLSGAASYLTHRHASHTDRSLLMCL